MLGWATDQPGVVWLPRSVFVIVWPATHGVALPEMAASAVGFGGWADVDAGHAGHGQP
jgi:hypothetical protein